MFLDPFLLTGPLRIILIFVLLIVLYRVAASKVPAQTALNFLIPSVVLIFSASILGGFFLILIQAFDLFVILSIILGIVIFVFMDIKFRKSIKDQLQKIYTRSILYVVIKLEKRESFIDRDNWEKPKLRMDSENLNVFNRNWQVFIGLSLPVITYLSRSSLFQHDTSTLSAAWYQKLALVKNISLNNWFFNSGDMMGDYLLIDLYSKITNISEAVALQSSGLLESSLLSVVIYWVVYKICRKHASGIVAGLSFSLLYAFLPLNLDLLVEHKSIFAAMILALPAMLFSIYPQTFRFRKKTAGLILIILFSAILLLDLFVGLLVCFPFLVLVFLFRFWRRKRQMIMMMTAYVLSVLGLGLIYGIAAWWFQEDFSVFIRSNLFSYNSYTYNPKLLYPLKDFIGYYQIAGLVFLGLNILKFIQYPKNFKASLIFLTFINLLFLAYQLNLSFVDMDMLNEVLCIFIPVFFGISFNLCITIFSRLRQHGRLFTNLEIGTALTLMIALVYFTFPKDASFEKVNTELETEVFKAYAKIQDEHLPYSYAVVNSLQNSTFSGGSHYFYNYNYFNNKYLAQDKLFQEVKTDINFLRANPGVILPQNLFVFVYNGELEGRSRNGLQPEEQQEVRARLDFLRNNGRQVMQYYKSEAVDVYVIVNEPGTSKIQELLF